MADGEAVKLKVPRDTYDATLRDLQSVLERIQEAKTTISTSVVDRIGEGSESFSGTDVQSTVDLAKEILRRLENAYVKYTAQRDTLQDYLTQTENDASELQGSVSSTTGKLPDIFN